MRILFVHQNVPGQFRHLVRHLAARGDEVIFVTRRTDLTMPGVRVVTYEAPPDAAPQTHPYLRGFESAVRHGQQVARVCQALARAGRRPDVIVAHPGWGEALFIKDVFPDVPLIDYCEFYYDGRGADVGFDPADPPSLDTICRTRARNAPLLLSLEACDLGLSPTEWQKSRHPAAFRDKIRVIHEGIDVDAVRPDPAKRLTLPNGRVLAPGDPVITHVARNLEPYRGFPQFVEALPEILARRPAAQVVIVGGDETSYGKPPPGGGSWRAHMAERVPLDPDRVHFLGRVPWSTHLAVLAVSAVHVYLTWPFVLSWSVLEAMASGCRIVASATPPVTEVIEDGIEGRLFDFFDRAALVDRVIEALDDTHADDPLRLAARARVVGRFALERCLAAQVAMIESLI